MVPIYSTIIVLYIGIKPSPHQLLMGGWFDTQLTLEDIDIAL